MPRIKMTDGKSQSIKAFKNPIAGQNPLLVIDLDYHEGLKADVLHQQDLTGKQNEVFFMIQEMEAWFLSQPDILDECFGVNISGKIINKPQLIDNPSDKLKEWTKHNSRQKTYHKVRHGVALLQRLKLEKLMEDFADVKLLVEKLNS